MKLTLQENITFFQNNPIEMVMQVMGSRGYNNPTSEFNDIIIVSIPKEELQQNKKEIINEQNGNRYLNPEYIAGYVKVGVEKGNLDSFRKNPKFIEKDRTKQDIESLSVDDWKNKFEKWYEDSRTTKMQKLKSNIIGFFKSVLSKENNKSLDDGYER